MLENLVVFLLIGIFAGWISALLSNGQSFGLSGNFLVGATGSVLGGFLFSALDIGIYGITGSVMMAVIGSTLLLFLFRFVFNDSVQTEHL